MTRGLAALQGLVALGAAGCAVIGIWFRGSDGVRIIETSRGPVEVVVGGLYAGNSPAVVAEGIGWDVVTLFMVVPLLLGLLPAVWRSGVRARIAAAGGLFYCLYQYFQYAITYAFGPLFVAFVLVAGLALVGLAWTLGSLPRVVASDRYPRRLMLAIMVAVPLALIVMWSGRIAALLADPSLTEGLYHHPTLPVQAMDLVWLCALGLLIAVLIVRRHPAGYLAATVLAVKGAAMGFAIFAMLLGAAQVSGELAIGLLLGFAVLGLGCSWAATRGVLAYSAAQG